MKSPFRSQLDLLLLATIAGRSLHGYAVIQQLAERSNGAFALPEGTIYPVLHRLEREGLLVSEWAEQAGRRSRVYRLSGAGAEALLARTDEWRRFRATVDGVLEGSA
jgi:DNA-binding PadR family transcriptional regulator